MELGLRDVEVRRLRRTLDKLQNPVEAQLGKVQQLLQTAQLDKHPAASALAEAVTTANEVYDGSVVAAAQPTAPVSAQLARAAEPAFVEGDRVTWAGADGDIPAGTVGTVQGPSKRRPGAVVVSFPSGSFGIPSSQLRPAIFRVGKAPRPAASGGGRQARSVGTGRYRDLEAQSALAQPLVSRQAQRQGRSPSGDDYCCRLLGRLGLTFAIFLVVFLASGGKEILLVG